MAASVQAKVARERLGHAGIAMKLDTYFHVRAAVTWRRRLRRFPR